MSVGVGLLVAKLASLLMPTNELNRLFWKLLNIGMSEGSGSLLTTLLLMLLLDFDKDFDGSLFWAVVDCLTGSKVLWFLENKLFYNKKNTK